MAQIIDWTFRLRYRHIGYTFHVGLRYSAHNILLLMQIMQVK